MLTNSNIVLISEMGESVEFGVKGTVFSEKKTPNEYRSIAETAEKMEFDRVAVGDHIAIPVDVPNTYPFSSTGESNYNSTYELHDQFMLLTSLAEVTNEIRLASRVTVVPYRHPVLLAKLALTLDSLSEGRFEFGVGSGWLSTEFEVLDVPFEERNSRLDEFLALFVQVCRTPELAFDGPHHSFQKTGFYPRPVQDGGPPIFLGGHSGPTLRRVAEFGAGLHVTSMSAEEASTLQNRLLNAWEDYDRAGDPLFSVSDGACIVELNVSGNDEEPTSSSPFVGTADEIIASIQEYAAAGVDDLVFSFNMKPADQIAQLEAFGREILPSF